MSTYSKNDPFFSRIVERYPLTKKGSQKLTYHIELDVENQSLPYKVGDSIGIFPQNSHTLVIRILNRLELTGNEIIEDPRKKDPISSYEYFSSRVNLSRISASLCTFLLPFMEASKQSFLSTLLTDKSSLQAYLNSFELYDFFEKHVKKTPPLSELASYLAVQLPRFYSIASSQQSDPNRLHLTVRYLEYVKGEEKRVGVASHFLCTEAKIATTPIPLYLHPTQHFTLPDPSKDIIMIGPGTGVAPFRAFLQERLSNKAPGKNWLFFGERNRAHDFYYEDFFRLCEKKHGLKLSTAFSRDQVEKSYVQHKLWDAKAQVWQWLEKGAYFYVCGDAKKMAKDVEKTLLKIIEEEGSYSEEEAKKVLIQMRREKRYLLDVY